MYYVVFYAAGGIAVEVRGGSNTLEYVTSYVTSRWVKGGYVKDAAGAVLLAW